MASTTLEYLGPYRLLNVVNTGQTSRIWQAYDDRTRHFVGVKVLLEKYRRDREQINALKWEHVVAGNLQDDHIIRIHEFKASRGIPYLAMEWFSAPNLKQFIRLGPDRIAYRVPSIVDQAILAMCYFAEQGWVHRDVKPDNFLLNDDGLLKLIDFALAVRIRRGLARLFPSRTKVQGTKSYMSPEQILGKPLDERSDVYSLGCSIFELVGGRPPYTGTSGNDLLLKHLRSAPPSLEVMNKNVTPEFAQLIRSAMAKRPRNRPESFRDFLAKYRMVRIYKRTPKPPDPGVEGAN